MIRRAASVARCSSAYLLIIPLIAACSGDEILPAELEEICFSTGWEEPFTRSTPESKWEGGECLVVTAGTQTKRYTVKRMDGSDGSSCSLVPTSDGAIHWARTDTMHISAYYSPVREIRHNFKIETGQNIDAAFLRSDALYAPTTVVDYNTTAHLNFRHLTAQVKLTVTADEELNVTNINVANIKIVNQHNESDSLRRDGSVRQRTTAGSYQITPQNVSSDKTQRTVRALLVPQRLKDITFLLVVVNLGDDTDGTTFYYTPTGDEEINLEAGKSYTFNVRLTRYGIVVTSVTIENWTKTETDISSSDRELKPSDSSTSVWDRGDSTDVTSSEREDKPNNETTKQI
jgi:hypothetical protein